MSTRRESTNRKSLTLFQKGVLAAPLVGLIVLTAVFLKRSNRDLTIVPLNHGTQLRILSVDLVERNSRRKDSPWTGILPQRLRSSLFRSKDVSSLVLYLAEFDPIHQTLLPPTFKDPRILLYDDTTAPGESMITRSNTVRVEFKSFPRSASQLTIRLATLAQTVSFQIPNPIRTNPLRWTAPSLPCTNRLFATEVILEERQGDSYFPLQLKSVSLTRDSMKWNQWNCELIDGMGNWTGLEMRGARIRSSIAPLIGSCFKLVGRCSEYISAGMVSIAQDGEARELVPELRALDLGLERVFLLGKGQYRIPGNGSIEQINSDGASSNALNFAARFWPLTVACTNSSLLIIYRGKEDGLAMKARLRERRSSDRGGSLFYSWKSLAATNGTNPALIAHLFPLSVRTKESKLEAEIIVEHPPVEFYVPSRLFINNAPDSVNPKK